MTAVWSVAVIGSRTYPQPPWTTVIIVVNRDINTDVTYIAVFTSVGTTSVILFSEQRQPIPIQRKDKILSHVRGRLQHNIGLFNSKTIKWVGEQPKVLTLYNYCRPTLERSTVYAGDDFVHSLWALSTTTVVEYLSFIFRVDVVRDCMSFIYA